MIKWLIIFMLIATPLFATEKHIFLIELNKGDEQEVIDVVDGKVIINGETVYESELLKDACIQLVPNEIAPTKITEYNYLVEKYYGYQFIYTDERTK